MSAKKKSTGAKKAAKQKIAPRGDSEEPTRQGHVTDQKPGMSQHQIACAALYKMGENPFETPELFSPEFFRLSRERLGRSLSRIAEKYENGLADAPPKRISLNPPRTLSPESEEFLRRVAAGETELLPPTCEENLLSTDPVVQILSMPNEFRQPAAKLILERGIRFFGKTPLEKQSLIDGLTVADLEILSDGKNSFDMTMWISVGPPRPMGCPEPTQASAQFALAWEEDGRWVSMSDPLPENAGDTPEGGSINSIKSLATWVLSEIRSEQFDPALITIAKTLSRNLLSTTENSKLFPFGDLGEMFRLGRIFERSLCNPWRTGDETSRVDSSQFIGWRAIIRHARIRHRNQKAGTWPDRKALLGHLGCCNPNDLSRDSDVTMEFEFRFSPKIAFKTFYKSYGEVMNSLTGDSKSPEKRSKRKRAKCAADKKRRMEEKELKEAGRKAGDLAKARKAAQGTNELR